MSMRFDSVAKDLVDGHPPDWLILLGRPVADAEPLDFTLLDTDLSTVTSQADRVLRVGGPKPCLEHIEFETGHHGSKTPPRLLRTSVLLTSKFELPVRSSVVLLRREADSPALTGELQYHTEEAPYLTFRFNVVRVWRLSVDSLLTGGIGTLPLAPLSDFTEERLPEVMSRLKARVEAETTGEETGNFWTATKILMGLRYPPAVTDELLKGVRGMKESATYQAILEEGREEGLLKGLLKGHNEGRSEGRSEGLNEGRVAEARRMLLLGCSTRFGEPSAIATTTLNSIDSVDRLEYFMTRIFAVETWEELFESE